MAKVVLLPGDGIGPEILQEAKKVIHAVAKASQAEIDMQEYPIGGGAFDEFGAPLPQHTLEAAQKADAVLLAAVGGPKWDTLPGHQRPEKGLLELRKGLNAYANIRPVRCFSSLVGASTLRAEVVNNVDLVIIRELTGGVYFGEKKRWTEEQRFALDTLIYSEEEVRRIVKVGFETARQRRKHLTSVDKANVLDSSRMWREIVEEMKVDYPDVTVSHMLVDNCAMQLIRNPGQFDVVVTENMFGDILSDEASMLTGSIGMLPSASLGDQAGLYEPIHGSAPDIAGKGIANPCGIILSTAMMFRNSLGLSEYADKIEQAVNEILEEGYRTADLAGNDTDPSKILSTSAMGDRIVQKLVG
ncbi:3-isopropylmalate dehydrogenase [Fodinisporobacter ferrooxydans]|uniref:3-isopropylmalate dehydrogenase n=1 Tax=Fodinisporobacter ferrooxydans TaxID=2901836 RepID=A0ABY4CTY1_9BACL|nr:3-isopropylmalate dehydrogenase [Alicyclobacillaceae bacterium MYW30-H2]